MVLDKDVLWHGLSQFIRHLLQHVDGEKLHQALAHSLMEVMVANADVLGPWAHLGQLGKL